MARSEPVDTEEWLKLRTRSCPVCGEKYRDLHTGERKRHCSTKCQEAARNLWRHGLTFSDYRRILKRQNGVCAICGTTESSKGDQSVRFAVDHDHSCCPGKYSCGKCVRGLLCVDCNSGHSNYHEDPAILRAAADYFERWQRRAQAGGGRNERERRDARGDAAA